jgi:hypothetical protein
VIGNATPLGIVGGLLGGNRALGGTTDICPTVLAVARGQPVAETAPAPAPPGAANVPNKGAILKNLFR